MATTDTRSGFRLPWSSDRPHDDTRPEESVNDVVEPAGAAGADRSPDAFAQPADDGSEAAGAADEAWPDIDVNARLNLISTDPSSASPTVSPPRTRKEPEAMVDTVSVMAPGAAMAPRKPSKLIADLAAAMRTTAEAAREQALAQVEADSRQVVEAIRAQSTEGTAALRSRSEEDIVGIRDWSKAEIARIREETERKIGERKAALEAEIAGHAAAIERRVEDVQEAVSAYEARMATFFEHLLQETDPARLAAMAESMPEPPSLEIWADLDEPGTTAAPSAVVEAAPEPDVEGPALPEPEAIAPAVESAWPAEGLAAVEAQPEIEVQAAVEAQPEIETQPEIEASVPAEAAPEPEAIQPNHPEAATPEAATPAAETVSPAWAGASWSDDDSGWTSRRASADDGHTGAPANQRADRAAIMAALEADAEAVVAAEAAEASDVAATGMDDSAAADEIDQAPNAEAEASLAARLASLLPGHDNGAGSEEAITTQVVVTGLVSVASIASFKRHLGRLTGVQSVSVASGPEGEFMFNVTHRPDLSFRDVIPTMPGFGARVAASGEGVVNVTARDPEAES